jgi:hypothetical protein
MRYHKKVFYPANAEQTLKDLTDRLNKLDWKISTHSLENIKYRAIDLRGILEAIKGLILEPDQVFEYYTEDKSSEIIKACYRINFNNGIDIILVLSNIKNVITIYLNSSNDVHYTLKKELYCLGT